MKCKDILFRPENLSRYYYKSLPNPLFFVGASPAGEQSLIKAPHFSNEQAGQQCPELIVRHPPYRLYCTPCN
jgi:hypothetical protein